MGSDRYSRQIAILGKKHEKLRNGTVAIVGCGGLGCVVGSQLARTGVNLVLIDNDQIEQSNLPRQELYVPGDLGRSKVAKAGLKLQRINPDIHVCIRAERLGEDNATRLLDEVDVIADCTDNFPSRIIINRYSLRSDVPWVYGGVAETEGRVWAIVPGETACLFCTVDASIASDDKFARGVLGTAVGMVGSIQANEIMKLLMGDHTMGFMTIDAWNYKVRYINVKRLEKCECHDIRQR
jgi:molybdopterin/thiamine biosynthesis adenylyltransferase